jgi:3-carboxy-cis,cis-muconate cycloisomerase
MLQEHERAAGAWHAEWAPLRSLLVLAAGAVERIDEALGDIHVDAARMKSNLDATGGAVLAEALVLRLAPVLGREAAAEIVAQLCDEATARGESLIELARQDERITSVVDADELAALLEPAAYLGATDAFITRALAVIT